MLESELGHKLDAMVSHLVLPLGSESIKAHTLRIFGTISCSIAFIFTVLGCAVRVFESERDRAEVQLIVGDTL